MINQIKEKIIDFLENYSEASLTGKEFYTIIGSGDSSTKFKRLLRASGYEDDSEGFCKTLIAQLESANHTRTEPVRINTVVLPNLMLMSVLEVLIPGNHFVSIKDVAQLEELTNTKIPEHQREDMQKVIEIYPVRLSMHTIRQMRISKHIACQYMPFAEELDTAGYPETWTGLFQQGLMEQMYQNRLIFLLNMTCPVYCRFCFRKHKEARNHANPGIKEIQQAVAHVKNSLHIKEILITGGDPFLTPSGLTCAIDGLMTIPHVQTLRLATRSIAYYPHLFCADNDKVLNDLKLKNLKLQQHDKRMEIATHFIHPDEISPESLYIISELVRNGIPVYVQTPLLNNCNDNGPDLVRLFSLLRGAGAEIHYIFTPCSSTQGNSRYWVTISKGIEIGNYLRAHLSDRAIPKISTSTSIGKIEWHTSGWAVEQDSESKEFIWIRTPYTPEYFKAFVPAMAASKPCNPAVNSMIRVNEEGTIDIRYMAEIGDESLFIGNRPFASEKKKKAKISILGDLEGFGNLQGLVDSLSLNPPYSTLSVFHKTCVELDVNADDDDFAYIRQNQNITDVVISSEKDIIEDIYLVCQIIQRLRSFPHVNAVRLRSLKLNYAPERYTQAAIERLGAMNRLTVVHPQRLEIETQFLHSAEILPIHKLLTRALNNKGITVYNNTPLLTGINDTPDEISKIAYRLRASGIEFHQVYVEGLPLQKKWNKNHPADADVVIDIASRIRRDGSGREIPRYVIRTEYGDADFRLSSSSFPSWS